LLWNDTEDYTIPLPKQQSTRVTKAQISAVGKGVQAATGLSTLTSFMLTAALSQLWGMINGM